MSEFRLIIHPFAEKDIQDARDWYREQKQDLDGVFLLEVKQTLLSIEDNPLQFPQIKKGIRKAVVCRFPYTVFFTINTPIINVFALFHTSRNPNIWEQRK
jgi:plasmid stabilization system protein ParE